ncbi:hypothetical protein FD754_008852 [Muntiacus muntjak]|uniref:Mos1 transposase HTH domain-containing protein n=1 Tax=Muntiacus muntjak TaxID=9888 RepID=A0A5N3WWW0_MUNMU|nr:hypothetical protein FD754_008852 [Muntiacus muntjak]
MKEGDGAFLLPFHPVGPWSGHMRSGVAERRMGCTSLHCCSGVLCCYFIWNIFLCCLLCLSLCVCGLHSAGRRGSPVVKTCWSSKPNALGAPPHASLPAWEMMLDRKQVQVTFLLEFKMGHKGVETTCNNVFGLGTANEYTVQWWLKRFCRGDESLEDEEHKIAQELEVDHSVFIWRLKQIGKVETLDEWEPHELTKNFKNCRFEVLSSHILWNNKPFLDQNVMCDEKWILYDNQQQPTQWLDQEEAPECVPKPNLHPKKVMVIVRWSAASLIHYSFLSPGKTTTSEKKGPVLLRDNARLHIVQLKVVQASKVERTGLHLPSSPDLLPTDDYFFKHLDNFLQGKCFHSQQEAENAFQEINKLISCWQKCVDCHGSYFD